MFALSGSSGHNWIPRSRDIAAISLWFSRCRLSRSRIPISLRIAAAISIRSYCSCRYRSLRSLVHAEYEIGCSVCLSRGYRSTTILSWSVGLVMVGCLVLSWTYSRTRYCGIKLTQVDTYDFVSTKISVWIDRVVIGRDHSYTLVGVLSLLPDVIPLRHRHRS